MWIVVRWLLLTYGSVLLRNLLAQTGTGIPRAIDPVLMVALITLLDAPTGYGFLRSAVPVWCTICSTARRSAR